MERSAVERVLDGPQAEVTGPDQRDAEEPERCTECLEGPERGLVVRREQSADADSEGDRGQPRPPPGEVVRSFASRVRRVASSSPGSRSDRVRGVRELAELASHQVGDLLPDVHGVVADPLDAPRHDQHPQPVLALLRSVAERENVLGRIAVRAVDELVELDERQRLSRRRARRMNPWRRGSSARRAGPCPRSTGRSRRPVTFREPMSLVSFATVTQ